ncbi:hypothetical protein PF008_g3801 [Phytophthora fragariae]|uniref:Secreted protein n=1 Tax=Phytophthora fragariae TaxID=53985 RepID=A0A6G0SDE3_9STRA|nr:hypothetical protein PF008_g3801 [Phytophthora fragariae]
MPSNVTPLSTLVMLALVHAVRITCSLQCATTSAPTACVTAGARRTTSCTTCTCARYPQLCRPWGRMFVVGPCSATQTRAHLAMGWTGT